jgi:hypothetical protein
VTTLSLILVAYAITTRITRLLFKSAFRWLTVIVAVLVALILTGR